MIALSNFMDDGTTIKISENEKPKESRVTQVGIDSIGRYKVVVTPQGIVKKNYQLKVKTVKRLLADRYNVLHQYRREGDNIVVYYNTKTRDVIVLAVKPLDDLSAHPFYLKDECVVTQEMLDEDKVTPRKGIVSITKENLERLQKKGVLTEETTHVLLHNKNNVGFYL